MAEDRIPADVEAALRDVSRAIEFIDAAERKHVIDPILALILRLRRRRNRALCA